MDSLDGLAAQAYKVLSNKEIAWLTCSEAVLMSEDSGATAILLTAMPLAVSNGPVLARFKYSAGLDEFGSDHTKNL